MGERGAGTGGKERKASRENFRLSFLVGALPPLTSPRTIMFFYVSVDFTSIILIVIVEQRTPYYVPLCVYVCIVTCRVRNIFVSFRQRWSACTQHKSQVEAKRSEICSFSLSSRKVLIEQINDEGKKNPVKVERRRSRWMETCVESCMCVRE